LIGVGYEGLQIPTPFPLQFSATAPSNAFAPGWNLGHPLINLPYSGSPLS